MTQILGDRKLLRLREQTQLDIVFARSGYAGGKGRIVHLVLSDGSCWTLWRDGRLDFDRWQPPHIVELRKPIPEGTPPEAIDPRKTAAFPKRITVEQARVLPA